MVLLFFTQLLRQFLVDKRRYRFKSNSITSELIADEFSATVAETVSAIPIFFYKSKPVLVIYIFCNSYRKYYQEKYQIGAGKIIYRFFMGALAQ